MSEDIVIVGMARTPIGALLGNCRISPRRNWARSR